MATLNAEIELEFCPRDISLYSLGEEACVRFHLRFGRVGQQLYTRGSGQVYWAAAQRLLQTNHCGTHDRASPAPHQPPGQSQIIRF